MTKDHSTLTMEITPEFLEIFKEKFNLEIEILQGNIESLQDGRLKVQIVIEDELKVKMVREFCLKMISHSHTKNLS